MNSLKSKLILFKKECGTFYNRLQTIWETEVDETFCFHLLFYLKKGQSSLSLSWAITLLLGVLKACIFCLVEKSKLISIINR